MPRTLPHYTFGPFVLEPTERRLYRDGLAVALYPKAFDVLAVLVDRAGRLVTKDELLAVVWPGVVVEESALSVAVSRLRAALGTEGRVYIETVPGHGYRFAAPVTEQAPPELDPRTNGAGGPPIEDVVPTLSPSGDGLAPPGLPDVAPLEPARGRLPSWQARLLIGLGLLFLAATVLGVRGSWQADTPVPATPVAHESPPEALVAYRRGRALWEARTPGWMGTALNEFKLAADLDPSFARAHLGQAQVYATGYRMGPEAEAALARALALDSTLVEAWATLGFVRAFQGWDWAGAEAAFARARTLDPNDVTTLQWLASLRMVQRRLPAAEAALHSALARAPDYANLHADLCEALYYRRAYADALAACDRALALDPEHPFAVRHRFWIVAAMTTDGEDVTDTLLDELRRWYERYPGLRADSARFAQGDVESLLRGLVADLLADPAGPDDIAAARLYAHLGQRDVALTYVERVVSRRWFLAPFLNPDPLFDPVRDDPRWTAAIHRMGLE